MGSFDSSSAKSSSKSIHVVAVPLPAQGHMSPMMHLCKRIAAEPGVVVSFINVDSLHKEMMKHRIDADSDPQLRFDSIPFSWQTPTGFDVECLSNLGKWFGRAERELPQELEKLIRRLNDDVGAVRCIISDYYFPWTQDVADKLDIPRVILWSGCAGWTSFEYHIPDLLARDHIFPTKGRASAEEASSVIVDYIGGLAPLRLADLPDYMLSSEDKEWVELSIRRSPYVKRASWVLVNSFYELEKPTFDFMVSELGNRFLAAGPMFLLDEAATGPANVILRSENNGCIEWLDEQDEDSVIYISFGSIAVLTVEQFEELSAALEASGKKFLWVIRSELVVGGASEESYKDFCERTKDQGFIVSWAPQLRVLAHPAVGAFLTHCGWNSILESICHGVPMLGWPYGAEQNSNCKFVVEDWKIGTRFSKMPGRGLIGRSEIQSAIKKVMDDEEGKEMQRRVEVLKGLGRKAMDKQGGQSFINLMGFLKELRN